MASIHLYCFVNKLETFFDKYSYMLKNRLKLYARPKALQKPIFQKSVYMAEIEKLTPNERHIYDEYLKKKWDIQDLIDTAIKKAIKKKYPALAEKDRALAEKDKKIEELLRVATGKLIPLKYSSYNIIHQ